MKSTDINSRTYEFSLSIINFVSEMPQSKNYQILGSQLLRSATSVGANVVEAKCSRSKTEFTRFYEIALKSANETRYWLSLIKDSERLIYKPGIDVLLDENSQLCKILGSSILTLRGKKRVN